ncbi:MAG: alpha-L-rhamnosidase [Bacteroidales bacterium]|nr:alpha-L-rhamnosidase [Bacteroidales bacterium]
MKFYIVLFVACLHLFSSYAQELPPVFGQEYSGKVFHDSRARSYLTPQRIVWRNDGGGKLITNPEGLLEKGNNGQSELTNKQVCTMRSTTNEYAAILLDFGKEIQGGIQFVTTAAGKQTPVKIRVRFGESVSEAMSDIGKQGATNDHAMRDFTMELPWLGVAEIGNSGFRFVRIDLLEPDQQLSLKEINAVFAYRDIPYLGSFRCNDERLNQIWMTGAYTVHLNMQEYLWDGIKRDRLVWLGDLHPEVMTVSSVFGYNEVVPKSLDLARDITPLPGWMNGMCSYSLWWVIIHRDWYRYQGSLDYLKEQQTYLTGLLNLLFTKVDDSGQEKLDGGGRFLDWPSSPNKEGVDAGLQALMVMTFQAGSELCAVLGDKGLSVKCADMAAKMQKKVPFHNHLKQAASLQALAGMITAKQANEDVIAVGGAKNFSTFYGYYMLQAQAQAGEYQAAMNNISQYWGGMLDMGATSFWEDFDLDWTKNAARIDEIVPEGKKDIHADFGAYCYKNLRHSLCHGWASGPTAWLTEHVLGVQVAEPGCKVLRIEPNLGDLEWVEGTFPTPQGVVKISHKKEAGGKIKTDVKAPKGVKIIKVSK